MQIYKCLSFLKTGNLFSDRSHPLVRTHREEIGQSYDAAWIGFLSGHISWTAVVMVSIKRVGSVV